MADNIKVSVRLRKLIPSEKNKEILWTVKDRRTVSDANSSSSFSYDRVFAADENNEVVYDDVCAPIVKSVISGYNGTIFAYGQTSSGKTYTLMGDGKFDYGIAYYCVSNLFEQIQNMENHEFLLRISLMEIYNEKVMDLLVKKSENLEIQQDQYGTCKVLNLTELEVQEPEQVVELLRINLKKRKTGETLLNQRSSRSHLIFRMIIESRLRGDENASVKVSHFNLVDLAGSEKASDNSGARFKEGVNINKSLMTLSKIISELSAEKESQFIAFRNSKLTRILQNSLGGNALTAIICTITPASNEETLSTLKFALNAKKIKNKPQVNEVETEETLIKSYANKIQKLTKQLEATKEEKDQETKMRRDMQEQIEALRKKFVQFVPQDEKTTRKRRETWGGNMKNSLLQPSRPLKLAVVEEGNEMTIDNSEINSSFSVWNRISTVSSKYSLDSNWDEYSRKEDVGVQTDLLQNDKPSSGLNGQKENMKLYEDKIAELMKELTDLKHFTTLEKQMYIEKHSETKVMDKSINCMTFSPFLEKSRKLDVDLSVCDESFGVINSLINRKSQADRNIIDISQEMFFQSLNIVIKKLSNILNIETLLPSIANPYFKVIYQLANIIFQKHFIGYKDSTDEQIKDMFKLLTKIFVGFSDQENSDEHNSELLIHFDEMSEKLFKDIEKLSISSETDAYVETKISNISNGNDLSSESPNTYIMPSSCQCKDQIPLLEKSINTHLETISHLQSNHELLKKQFNLSEDKIKIQEQVITSLENEIKLKLKCGAEMADNFTQTSYMTQMNVSSMEPIDRKNLPKPSGDDSKISEMNCSNCLKPQNYSDNQNHELSEVKSQLFDLGEQIRKMMESSMPKAYYSDIAEDEPVKNLEANSVDSLKTEIAALKIRLHKIKFYIQDKTEQSEHIENKILGKMAEISSLQRQCSSTELALQEKEKLLNMLNGDICEFRKEVSEKVLSIRAMGVKLKHLELDGVRLVDDLTYLKRITKSFADTVVDSHAVLKDLHQHQALRQTKMTQTVDNYPDLAALEEIRAHEFKERAHLCQENTSLKLKLEELNRKVESLELGLKLKENNLSQIQKSYQEEKEMNLSRRKELQESLMETMQEHIKNLEDKYEEEIKNQEKTLFGMMDNKLSSLKEEYKTEWEKKQEHYEKLISELTAKCEKIKSDLQGKLSEEINEHEDAKLKLRNEIKDFENRALIASQAYYKLKNKFKEYVKSVQDMRMMNAKHVKEKETQTNSENTTAEACHECKNLRQEQKDLKNLCKIKGSELVSLENNNQNMRREIAALKRDLDSKYALLRTCNCRLIPRPKDMLHGGIHKTKVSDSAEGDLDQDRIGKKTDLDPREILKLDFVQKAIDEARESERAIFNSGEGPASQEMCILLRRKLNKKDKEISELRNIISQKQLGQNPPAKSNRENIPMHPLDVEVLNNFTPKTASKPVDDALLKAQPKKILLEKNKPEKVEAPRNKWFMTKEEEEMAKKLDEDQRKYRERDLDNCKQQ
ncbi:centromere-associated protein E [Parasteatoda tepidariorum]|uniref:centromere-associated protein E n=1 Tax=Parasteatoda tepidariorum TaxID=114398 RepID=UPI000A2C026E|nr:centromere-associated protein E [Parasteatoda tepidariorum]